MLSDNLLRKYAKLAVKAGVNVQKGQPLVISASVYDAKFVEYCVEEAYKNTESFINGQDRCRVI